MTLRLERFRGGDRMDAGTLRGAVIEVLRGDAAVAARPERDYLDAIDALLASGVGTSPVLTAYGQGLTLLAGTLLRLAGANMDAIRVEVTQRDEPGLEALIHAITARLRAAAGGSAVAAQPPPVSAHRTPTSDVRPPVAMDVASSPDLARHGQRVSAREAATVAGNDSLLGAAEGSARSDNLPLTYLRGLMSDDLAQAIRGLDAQASAARNEGAAVEGWLLVTIAPGVTISLRTDVAATMDSASARQDIARLVDQAMERLARAMQRA